jgi:hypothetical protein
MFPAHGFFRSASVSEKPHPWAEGDQKSHAPKGRNFLAFHVFEGDNEGLANPKLAMGYYWQEIGAVRAAAFYSYLKQIHTTHLQDC